MNKATGPGIPGLDTRRLLEDLHRRDVNYDATEVNPATWNIDTHRVRLRSEHPGPPETAGVWQTAARLIEDYEFSMPNVVRAVYDPGEPLLGRHMLLEGRFPALRLYLGVRVTTVVDETRAPDQRVWGWGYETLEGHLERGKITYEVVKHQDTGHVEFVITAHSQSSPALGPVLRLGWTLFGRRWQLRFYQGCGERMDRLVRTRQGRAEPAERSRGLVLAPSDTRPHPLDHLAIHRVEPG